MYWFFLKSLLVEKVIYGQNNVWLDFDCWNFELTLFLLINPFFPVGHNTRLAYAKNFGMV